MNKKETTDMELQTVQNTGPVREEEMEIDLLELLRAMRQKLWLIILAAVIGGGAAGCFSKFMITPQYTSTAMVYILSKETTLTSLADLQIGSQLTKDYKVMVTSRPVLETVIEELGLDMGYKTLRGKLTISNPADTRILSITAQDPDPYLAKQIADRVAGTASDYIGDIMEMIPPKMLEDGEVPTAKTSPSNGRNAMKGALVGIVLTCGFITFQVLMNDTIRSEEDVAHYLGLAVLASVPERRGETREDKEGAAKNHSRPGKRRKGGGEGHV